MILVTGATGFVGPRVVAALRARDLPVRLLVRDPQRAAGRAALGCELAEGDMTDAASLERAVEGVGAVVHLVAILTGRPEQFERVMTDGTRDLLRAAERAGVRRIVLMSALGTSAETRELVPYYRAKWEMERTVEASAVEHVIFRPSFVFGPGGGALQTFVRQVRWSPVTTVVGSGTQRLQPVWIEDVAEVFARAVDHPGAAGRTFDLGGPDVVTWNELYERIRRTLGKRRLTVHVPLALMDAAAAVLERLPGAPITRDQLKMLAAGDNVGDAEPARETFDIRFVGLDEQLRRSTSSTLSAP